jgi:hypothetical protein
VEEGMVPSVPQYALQMSPLTPVFPFSWCLTPYHKDLRCLPLCMLLFCLL